MKYQYNRTALQRIERDLQIRRHALPTLQAKETALRLEIKKLSGELKSLEFDYRRMLNQTHDYAGLWLELPDLLRVAGADVDFRNVAGVKIPVLKNMEFRIRQYSLYANRAWTPGALEILKEMCALSVQINLARRGLDTLHQTRKKTTQKVNLYQKVQIPGFEEAIRKIKRFLEDEDNLSKAAQKIVKARHMAREAGS